MLGACPGLDSNVESIGKIWIVIWYNAGSDWTWLGTMQRLLYQTLAPVCRGNTRNNVSYVANSLPEVDCGQHFREIFEDISGRALQFTLVWFRVFPFDGMIQSTFSTLHISVPLSRFFFFLRTFFRVCLWLWLFYWAVSRHTTGTKGTKGKSPRPRYASRSLQSVTPHQFHIRSHMDMQNEDALTMIRKIKMLSVNKKNATTGLRPRQQQTPQPNPFAHILPRQDVPPSEPNRKPFDIAWDQCAVRRIKIHKAPDDASLVAAPRKNLQYLYVAFFDDTLYTGNCL